jgi:Uma2 family endonuclease
MIARREPHRFSVDDYHRMIRSGILTENDGVELIRGEIVRKMPIGDKQIACVNRLTRTFSRRLGEKATVSIQNPIRLQTSEPEPDVALLKPKADDYASGKPKATDALLVIEVADTFQEYDRDVKMPLYAESGICEFWLVDVTAGQIEVYRKPAASGKYTDKQVLGKGQRITVEALPGEEFEVEELLV